ncbi:MAG: DinB family protein [Bacteroidetes bacterium]|nr:DinB family protein [Bacteroidota bacterium]
MNKLNFLRDEFPQLLTNLDVNTPPLFGKMNVHQMIEHMTDSIAIASGRIIEPNHQAEDLTAKMKNFMMSDKPFRDNTPNPLMPDTPLTPRHILIVDSINELQLEIAAFIDNFKDDADKKVTNPFFGDLNFEEWTHLLHKHALHHLRQFGMN